MFDDPKLSGQNPSDQPIPKGDDQKEDLGQVVTMPKPGDKPEVKPEIPKEETLPEKPISEEVKSSDIPTPVPPRMNMQTNEPKKKSNILLISIIIVLVLVVLGVGGYIYYTVFMTSQDDSMIIPAEDMPAVTNTVVDTEPVVELEPVEEPEVIEEPELDLTQIDSDGDGLSDAEELSYETSINLADTDRDDLNDYDEVMVYNTDPNNQDTDGDGFLDGEEVSHGYDPNGPGKLLNLEVK